MHHTLLSVQPAARFNLAVGLATPVLDHELADDRRAALEAAADTFDPSGLYALEVERDDAADRLAAAAAGFDVSLTRQDNRVKISGRWSADSREWQAMVYNAGGDGQHVAQFAPTATAAVEAAIASLAKLTAPASVALAILPPVPVRAGAESRAITDRSEALGVIDPETAADFLELVEERHGRSDFLAVDLAGLVTLAVGGYVCAEEAHALGRYVEEHNARATAGAVPARSAA